MAPVRAAHLNRTELAFFLTKMAAGKKGHRCDYRDTRGEDMGRKELRRHLNASPSREGCTNLGAECDGFL